MHMYFTCFKNSAETSSYLLGSSWRGRKFVGTQILNTTQSCEKLFTNFLAKCLPDLPDISANIYMLRQNFPFLTTFEPALTVTLGIAQLSNCSSHSLSVIIKRLLYLWTGTKHILSACDVIISTTINPCVAARETKVWGDAWKRRIRHTLLLFRH